MENMSVEVYRDALLTRLQNLLIEKAKQLESEQSNIPSHDDFQSAVSPTVLMDIKSRAKLAGEAKAYREIWSQLEKSL